MSSRFLDGSVISTTEQALESTMRGIDKARDVTGKNMRLLLLEDRLTDAELCERELARGGLRFTSHRVDTRSAFEAALDEFAPDLIISDFSLPNAFDGMAALELAQRKLPAVPFIFVSGTIGEERAVEALRRGATDYVLKDRLNRLVPVIKRALQEIEGRAAQRRAEQRIVRLSRFHAVLSGINSTIVRVTDRDQLLRDACRIAVEQGQFGLAWIGVLDRRTLEISPLVWQGKGTDLLEGMRSSVAEGSPASQGTTAIAARSRRPVIVNDIAGDPRVIKKAGPLERGFRALAALPLLVGGELFGVFKLYSEETGVFDQEEVKLLEELAGNISFALDHLDKAARVNYLAYYDSLTGLPNRALFHDRVAQLIGRGSGEGSEVAVMLLDLHRFRSINETHGTAAGDTLLKQVASRLTDVIAEPATVARLNADCFALAVAAPGREADIAHLLQKRVLHAFEEPFVIAGQELCVPAKVGIAVHPGDGDNAEMLCINAEAALRSAKQSGARYLFYARQMNARVAEKLKLEGQLQVALREERFVLHYQPRVEIATGRVSGLEALIRWANPERGLMPPAGFIQLLEETGMILEVGAWALRRAAADHAAWRQRGLTPPRIAVNVSAIQLRQKDFVESVRSAVAAGNGDADCIDIELTESVVMEDVESNISKLGEIRAAGMKIAIDDFGTGYSSLSYLVRLQADAVKIDRSFVSHMSTGPEHMAIVATVISLAHSLRLKVTAEGVETEEQRNLLRLLKCDEMQGYLYSKPLPSRDLIELLLKCEASSQVQESLTAKGSAAGSS